MEPDYYEILGVEPKTDIAIIKAQYRRLVRENHPDIATDKVSAHAKIQEIIAAWSVLSHPTQRHEYDERRRRAQEPTRPVAPSHSSSSRPRRVVVQDAKAEARKRARVRQVMGGGKARRDDNPRTRLLAMFLEAAQLYNVEGRSDDAVRVYQNILRADPTNAEAAVRIGDIYAEQKRRDVALAMYERAVRLQPANAEYRRKYNALRHPETSHVASDKRGVNPWRRNDSQGPLADRLGRNSPLPNTRTDSDATLESTETRSAETRSAETLESNGATAEANPPVDQETKLSLPKAAANEAVPASFLQRFRARMKREN